MENQESGDHQENRKEPIADYPSCPDKSRDNQQQLTCWLYVSRTPGFELQQQSDSGRSYRGDGLPRSVLDEAIRALEPTGPWQVSETHCGLIAGFARESDADKLLQRGDLARAFEGPVQVARFCDRDTRYRQAVLLRDVPWAIPLQDLNSALARQGIATGNIERLRHYVRVEILDAGQYEHLLRQGLDFFGARFHAIAERWWRNGGAPQSPFAGFNQVSNHIIELVPGQHQQQPPTAPSQQQQHHHQQQQQDDVLQCYRCQGFWHVAANCRQLPRCVRCGEPHSVEFCSRARNNPVCCHCSGPHHAGYRQCPVRLQLLNAMPVSLTLSTNRLSSPSSPPTQVLFPYGKSNGGSNSSGNSVAGNVTAASTPTTKSNHST